MSNYNILSPMITITCAVIDSSYMMSDHPDPVDIYIPLGQIRNVINAFDDAFDTIEDTQINNTDWALLGTSGSFDVFGKKDAFGNLIFEFGFDMEMMQEWEYTWRMDHNDAVSLVKYLEKIVS